MTVAPQYQLLFSREADEDLQRLFDFLLDRELQREGAGDLSLPGRAVEAIQQTCQILHHSPFSCRKVGASSFVRELIISFAHQGYVALFEVTDDRTVLLGAVRRQREDDYH